MEPRRVSGVPFGLDVVRSDDGHLQRVEVIAHDEENVLGLESMGLQQVSADRYLLYDESIEEASSWPLEVLEKLIVVHEEHIHEEHSASNAQSALSN